MQKRHILILLALTLILLIGAGAYFFTSSELLQGRFGNNFGPQGIYDNEIKGDFNLGNNGSNEAQNSNDELRTKLHELSQINPQLFFIYEDNMELFEENLEKGIFEDLNEDSFDLKPHPKAQTNEEILEEMFEYYESVDIQAYHFEEAFPNFFQEQLVSIKVEDKTIRHLKVKDTSLHVIENPKNNSANIELKLSEEAFIEFGKKELSYEELILQTDISMKGFNEAGQIEWELRKNLDTAELSFESLNGEILWQMSLK